MLTLSSAPGDDISRSDVSQLPALLSSRYTGIMSFIFLLFTVLLFLTGFAFSIRSLFFGGFPIFADVMCAAGLL